MRIRVRLDLTKYGPYLQPSIIDTCAILRFPNRVYGII